MTKEAIIKDFDAHLLKSGRRYFNDFYIGTSNDPEQSLFEQHHVAKRGHWYIYSPADNAGIACEVAEYYINKGMHGNVEGNEDRGIFVYAYTITQYTVE